MRQKIELKKAVYSTDKYPSRRIFTSISEPKINKPSILIDDNQRVRLNEQSKALANEQYFHHRKAIGYV